MICLLPVSMVTGNDESTFNRSNLSSSLNHDDVLLWLLLCGSSS